MKSIPIWGLALEIIGFSLLTYDLFKIRELEDSYGRFTDLLNEFAHNSGSVLFGSAAQLNILYNQLAVIIGVNQKAGTNTASSEDLAGRDLAIAQLIEYTREMTPPADLHELQLATREAAQELRTLSLATGERRMIITRYAILGTLFVLSGAIVQGLALLFT